MCLSQVTFLWGSKYSLNGFYLAVYRSLRLSIEHIVYTQCFGHAMCSNVKDLTFFSLTSLFFSSLLCFLPILWVNSCHKKNYDTYYASTWMFKFGSRVCLQSKTLCSGTLWCCGLPCEAVWECRKWIHSYEKLLTRKMLNTLWLQMGIHSMGLN